MSAEAKALGDEEPAVLMRVVLVGGLGVGKTNIYNVFQSRDFISEYKSTDGIEVGQKEIAFQGKCYELQLWDASGQDRFKSLLRATAREVDAVVGVYDITEQKSLDIAVESIKDTMSLMEKETTSKLALALVGNKLDREQYREVTVDKGQEMANKIGAYFIECSAFDNSNINDIFLNVIKERLQKTGKTMIWWKK